MYRCVRGVSRTRSVHTRWWHARRNSPKVRWYIDGKPQPPIPPLPSHPPQLSIHVISVRLQFSENSIRFIDRVTRSSAEMIIRWGELSPRHSGLQPRNWIFGKRRSTIRTLKEALIAHARAVLIVQDSEFLQNARTGCCCDRNNFKKIELIERNLNRARAGKNW